MEVINKFHFLLNSILLNITAKNGQLLNITKTTNKAPRNINARHDLGEKKFFSLK